MAQSISWRGNCCDNAELFWSRFKAELLDGCRFPELVEAQFEISHYGAYCNVERRHLATNRPTTSNPTFNPRPNCVRLI